jgi:hypothetical protein
MGLAKKTVIVVFGLLVFGAVFNPAPSISRAAGAAVLAGTATDAQWDDVNEYLQYSIRYCLVQLTESAARSGAWNPTSVSADYGKTVVFTNLVAEKNRSTEPRVRGVVTLTGQNAFGATVVDDIDVSATLAVQKLGNDYVDGCRAF